MFFYLLFLSFLRKPRTIGAVAPSSRFLGQAMAKYVPQDAKVLEIGAGTGALTIELIKKGLTDDRLFICEFDQDLYTVLKSKFAGYSVFCADACDAPNFMSGHTVDIVVSGLPMRNFSKEFKIKLVDSLKKVMHPKGSIIQFTYGFESPLPFLRGVRQEWVFANLPPAFIWQYWLD